MLYYEVCINQSYLEIADTNFALPTAGAYST